MRTITLDCPSGTSTVLVGPVLRELRALADPARTLIVTDARVRAAQGGIFSGYETVEIGEGEGNKTLEAVQVVYRALLDREADRSWTLVGSGGGIVCDVTGFAAATYMRGVRCGFVPTTLLAQLDASVGGKNGVNVSGYKNIAGVFRQPEFVLCDPSVLATLHHRDFAAGFAEAVKMAVLSSEPFFRYLEENAEAALERDPATLEEIVSRSVGIKAKAVEGDERESGPRAKLNLGHTIGHGIEAILGLRHGEAVSLGMLAAFSLAVSMGICPPDAARRAAGLLSAFGLPTGIDSPLPADTLDRVIDSVRKDKKRDGDTVKFVLPEGIGSARIERIALAELERAARSALS